MTTLKPFIKRHSLPIYFVLTFVISWGSLILLSGGPRGFPSTKEQFERLLPLFIPAVLAGPSLAGILLTGLVGGRAGFRELLSRLLRWRVSVRWYAVALLTAPLVLTAELLALSLSSQRFFPGLFATNDKASRLVMGLVAGLVVGLFEELGWTGFATPRLRLRYRIFPTGLILGVLWGAWHIFLNVIWVSDAYSGGLSPIFFLTARAFGDLVGLLPAYRVLMVWVYDRTGSLLVAILMHASLTASTMVVEPVGISGIHLLIYDLASTAAMWLVVAAIAVAKHGQLSRQPLRFKQIQQRGDAS
jgi:membrane protease YdiL (CAAX protease family)